MIRSAISAFTIILLCFAVFQVPSGSEYAPLPTATATPPVLMPVPDSDELWAAVRQLEDRVAELEKSCSAGPVASVVETTCVNGVCTVSPVAQTKTTCVNGVCTVQPVAQVRAMPVRSVCVGNSCSVQYRQPQVQVRRSGIFGLGILK